METLEKKIWASPCQGTGWLPPVPDLRDYTEYNEEIKPINKKISCRLPTFSSLGLDLKNTP